MGKTLFEKIWNRHPQQVVATADHNVSTLNQYLPIKDELSRNQLLKLRAFNP